MLTLLSIIFIILNILDVITTNKILRVGGFEANPIVRLLMEIKMFIPMKILGTLIVLYIIALSNSLQVGLVCCGIISLFCINNCYQLYQYYKE